MKRTTRLLAISVLMFGVQHAALAESPFPADAEASYDLPAIESYADRMARTGGGEPSWGASKRDEHAESFLNTLGLAGDGPFPSKGGPIDN